jgi:hypothetical protein
MHIEISGPKRAQLRAALLKSRAKSTLNDAEYVRQVLRVSLNTFKKCVGPDDPLMLTRQSFNRIVANGGLDPRGLGADVPVAGGSAEFGGYLKADFGYLAGRYYLHRRSFTTGLDISRAVLDIVWSESQGCLSFTEFRRIKTEAGTWQSNDFRGNIYIHQERVLMSLLAIDQGDARLTLLHIPPRLMFGTNLGVVRSSGAVLTHGYPRRFFQPVISAIAIEAVPASKRTTSPNTLCKTLAAGTPDFASAAEELKMAEEHAIVLTPMMWRDAQP